MAFRCLSALAGATVLAGCYAPPDAPPPLRLGALEPTSLTFQAVDAGTGAALADREMTVRYLVRSPIVFDASSVERVPSIEPYEISHAVNDTELVLEVRVEADSYHQLDTVLTVPRGSSAGPMTVRLSRRLDRVAQSTSAPSTPGPTAPGPTAPATTPGSATAANRTALAEGDRLYNQQSWLEATEAYQRLTPPADDMSEYGRQYLEARIRHGIAHINRSEYARALEIFEEVVDMESPGPAAQLRLAQTQCAVGRSEEGRGTLAVLERARSRMDPLQQSYVSAMVAYRRGVCSHEEFDRSENPRERVRTGAQATQELNAFVEGARIMSPVPPEVYDAVLDAERRVEDIKRGVVRGRGGE